jgi:PAS domain-containing protein
LPSSSTAPPRPPDRWAQAWRWLRAWFSAYETADEALAASFRARQMQAMLRLTPAAMLVNVANAVIIGVTLWGEVPAATMLAWMAAVAVLSGLGLRGWWRERTQPPRRTASRRGTRRAMVHAALLSAVWAALPLSAYGRLGSDKQYFVGMVLTGMICAGGFALASLPAVAATWVLVMSAGASLVLWQQGSSASMGLGTLLLIYSTIVVYSACTTAKSFGARLVAEARADQQNEVIGLLLRDFEDHASDLLWELDAAGRLRHVSPRLAAALGAPTAWLQVVPALRFLRRAVPDDTNPAPRGPRCCGGCRTAAPFASSSSRWSVTASRAGGCSAPGRCWTAPARWRAGAGWPPTSRTGSRRTSA